MGITKWIFAYPFLDFCTKSQSAHKTSKSFSGEKEHRVIKEESINHEPPSACGVLDVSHDSSLIRIIFVSCETIFNGKLRFLVPRKMMHKKIAASVFQRQIGF